MSKVTPTPPGQSLQDDDIVLLNAYLDNELDAVAARDVERRIDESPSLQAERDKLTALRSALAVHLRKDRASDRFRARIDAIAAPPSPSLIRTPSRTLPWRQMAAAAVVSAVLSAAGTYALVLGAVASTEVATLVDSHRRALLGAAPFDMASSDRHTVKPWFDGKLALSPRVVDLAADGFALAGGRIDVIAGKAVPVMVYQRRGHVISVAALPLQRSAGGDGDRAASSPGTRDGYAVIAWDGPDFRYSVVSDLAVGELSEFVGLFRKAMRAP